jgi:hypothetical protein
MGKADTWSLRAMLVQKSWIEVAVIAGHAKFVARLCAPAVALGIGTAVITTPGLCPPMTPHPRLEPVPRRRVPIRRRRRRIRQRRALASSLIIALGNPHRVAAKGSDPRRPKAWRIALVVGNRNSRPQECTGTQPRVEACCTIDGRRVANSFPGDTRGRAGRPNHIRCRRITAAVNT